LFQAFRQTKLEKGEVPEIWVFDLEEIFLKLKDMELHMTYSQFLVQLLNSLTNEYELQMDLMEKHIGNKETPLPLMKHKRLEAIIGSRINKCH
jgi:hypothetical protein